MQVTESPYSDAFFFLGRANANCHRAGAGAGWAYQCGTRSEPVVVQSAQVDGAAVLVERNVSDCYKDFQAPPGVHLRSELSVNLADTFLPPPALDPL